MKLSPKNQALVLAARPDATDVRGYRQWLAAGRQVRAGEHSVRIWAPTTRKNAAGEAETRFVLVPVFDVAQTDAAVAVAS